MTVSIKKITAFIFSGCALVLSSACSEKDNQDTASQNFHSYQTNEGVIKNDALSMKATPPEGWYILSEDELKQLFNIGTEITTSGQDDLKAVVDSGMKRSIPLFAIFELPQGSAVPVNPNVIAIAENVAHAPGVKTGEDYFFHSKKLMEQSNVNYEFEDGYSSRQFGNATFTQMNLRINVVGNSVDQSYFAARHGDYIVNIIASPRNETTDTALNAIAFDWAE